MNLYRVSRDGVPVGLAYETSAGQIYVYVPNTGKFHRNDAQAEDFYVTQESTYEPVTRESAAEEVRAELGKIDERKRPDLIKEYEEDQGAIPAADIVGAAPPAPRSARAQAAARASVLAKAERGTWLTWKVYPRQKRQLAYVAVTDIKSGKVGVLHKLGKIEARVEDFGDHVEVRVSRARL